MKKMNNRGFTLIELLAVVVILLAISVIAISSISSAIERNKVKQNNAKKEVIVAYGRLYYEENKNRLEKELRDDDSGKDYGCIEMSELDLDDNESMDVDGKHFLGVVIFKTGGTYFEYSDKCLLES